MVQKTYYLLLAALVLFTGCTATLDKQINGEDLEEVKTIINSDENYSELKKKYITDNLSTILGFLELGQSLTGKNAELPSFREEIESYSLKYDSIRTVKLNIRENNNKLANFLLISDANAFPRSKYKGSLFMTLDFNNQFEKEILYIIFEYKYVNKYDSEFFSEKTKLTDEIAKDFKESVEIGFREEYNNVASFLYTKMPVTAKKELIKELGEKKANEKVKKDFLLEGLKVSTLGIVFTDKTELMYQNADWEYLEEE